MGEKAGREIVRLAAGNYRGVRCGRVDAPLTSNARDLSVEDLILVSYCAGDLLCRFMSRVSSRRPLCGEEIDVM